ALDLGRALDRVDHARELGEHVVAGGVHDPTVVPADGGGDHLTVLGDRANGGRLVVPHEAAVAGGIGAEDGDEPAFLRARVHDSELYRRASTGRFRSSTTSGGVHPCAR